ncbi:MAG: hypothetical protein ABS948_17645 [Solibacillus sp.]
MDLWVLFIERYMFLSFFIILLLISLFLLFATWKKHAELPKSLTLTITVICTIIIALSILALIFGVSFGYNS